MIESLNRNSLQDFLDTTVRHRNLVASVDLATPTEEETPVQELTDEENIELIQTAMSNLNLKKETEETETDEYKDVPKSERPVSVPDFSGVREELVRFSSAEWFQKIQEKVIILAGVGGIGSNMAVILAKLNPSAIYIFDNDTVESVNLAGQFYSNEDVGKPKVDALTASVIKYTNYSSIFAVNRRYERGESIVSDIMICGFDSMRSRRTYFDVWKERVFSLSEEERKNCLFIDGRLTADEFQIFCMTGEDDYYMQKYEREYLFEDWEAPSLLCSFKQTGFLADMIGAFMVNLVVNFCANQVNPSRGMSLPFRTSYRTDMMYLDLVK